MEFQFPPVLKIAGGLSLAWFVGATAAVAAPAPWYQWRSVTGALVCAQTSPGPAWIRLDQAFVDARCQRRDPSMNATKPAGAGK